MAATALNSLNAFLAVARKKSFAAAGRDLGVSTSALSQSVRQLENRLGVPLLARTSRSVALTDAGQRLLETAGPAVDQALESLKSVTARPGEVTGRVRSGPCGGLLQNKKPRPRNQGEVAGGACTRPIPMPACTGCVISRWCESRAS